MKKSINTTIRIFLCLMLLVGLQTSCCDNKAQQHSHQSHQALIKSSPEKAGFSAKRLEKLTHTLENYATHKKLSGGVTLIARHGKIAYLKAFGKRDVEKGDPMKTDAIFRIASQTKAFVSVAIMMLQEDGKLLISDPLSKYIPDFKKTTVAIKKEKGGYDIVPAKSPITLRQLLTHTAGIDYGWGAGAELWEKAGIQGWYFAHRDEPIATTVAKMAKLPMVAHPGEKFIYGYNTDILGVVVEKVSGMSLKDFLTKRLFKPLKMNDTYFYLPKEKAKRLATVYAATENGIKRAPGTSNREGQGAYVEGPRKSFSGGAGCLSTATDYARFLQMMLNGGSFNGKQIISSKTVALMTKNHLRTIKFPWDYGVGFGLGFSIAMDIGKRGTLGSVGEFGWGGAYHSVYWVDPVEDLVVVYFTQLIPALDIDDHKKLRALVYQALE